MIQSNALISLLPHALPLALQAIAALSLIVGFLLPYVIRILNKDIQDDNERLVITYLVCFVAAMIIDYKSLSSGDLLSLIKWFAIVNAEAQASFKLYFSPKWAAAAQSSQDSTAAV